MEAMEDYLAELSVSQVSDLRRVYESAECVNYAFKKLPIESFQRFVDAAALTALLKGTVVVLNAAQRDEIYIAKAKAKLAAMQSFDSSSFGNGAHLTACNRSYCDLLQCCE